MKASFKFSCFALLVTLLVLSFAASPLFAQVDTGAVLGTVTDQTGGVINGAKVTLTNEGTGVAVHSRPVLMGCTSFRPSGLVLTRLMLLSKGSRRLRRRELS